MKILAGKVFHNGKEFIVNNWPGEADYQAPDHVKEYLQSALTTAIEEGYLVKDNPIDFMSVKGDVKVYLRDLKEGFYTLLEPREFECTEEPNYKSSSKEYFNRIAILLPKQPVTSPEPSEEINIDWIIGIESEAKEALDELPVALCADDKEENIFFQGYYAAASRYKKGNPDKEQEELWFELWALKRTGSKEDIIAEWAANFEIRRKPINP